MAKNGKKTKATVDKKQSAEIRKLQRMIGEPERKHYWFSHHNTPQTYSNAMRVFNVTAGIAQGVSDFGRIGNKILLKQIKYRLHVHMTSAGVYNAFRVVMLIDNKYDGIAPGGSDILQDYDTTDGYWRNFSSPINSHSFGKNRGYTLLSDKVIPINGLNSGIPTNKFIEFTKSYKRGKQTNYSGTLAQTGQVFVCLFPGIYATSAQNASVVLMTEVKYTDI